MAAAAMLWFGDAWRTGEFRLSSEPMQIPIIGLIAIGLVQMLPIGDSGAAGLLSIPSSNALSLDPYATRLFTVRMVLLLVFFAAGLTYINTEKRLKFVVYGVVIFGAVMAFFGILQRLAQPDAIYGMRPTPQAIPFGPFVNQHHFAAFMEMTAGLTLGLAMERWRRKEMRPILLLTASLMGAALVFTSSRGGMLSFLGVGAFLLASRFLLTKRDGSEQRTGRFAAVAAGAALLLVIFGLVLFLGGGESLVRGIGLTSADDVTSGRSHFWQVSLKIFADHPIIGAGMDAFGAAYTQYDTRNGVFRVEQAHNDYLQTLTDAGILGFVCVAAFIVLLFRRSLATIREAHEGFRRGAAVGALAGCFGVLIHSFFDFPLRTPSNAFVFLILAVIATVHLKSSPNSHRRRSTKHRSV